MSVDRALACTLTHPAPELKSHQCASAASKKKTPHTNSCQKCPMPQRTTQLVVDHVLRSCGKLRITFDDLVDRIDQVLLSDALPPGTDGVHTGLRANAAELGTSGVGAEPGEQLESDVTVHRHRLGVDLEDV